MIREIIKPTTNSYNIIIPDEYINKEVEILILPFSDTKDLRKLQISFEPNDFYGLGSSSKSDIDAFLNSRKSDWEHSF